MKGAPRVCAALIIEDSSIGEFMAWVYYTVAVAHYKYCIYINPYKLCTTCAGQRRCCLQ